jgi:hypothetical protein
MAAVMMVAMFGSIGVTEYQKGQAKIACYEAAKTNPKINCKE